MAKYVIGLTSNRHHTQAFVSAEYQDMAEYLALYARQKSFTSLAWQQANNIMGAKVVQERSSIVSM